MRPTEASHRSPIQALPALLGLHCAVLSLISGTVSLVVAFMLWWRYFDPSVATIGAQAGVFSGAMGLLLAGIAFASPRKGARRVAMIALGVNVLVLILTLDSIFRLLD